jgi:hypothetical protein
MKNLEVQLIRPPVPVRGASAGYLFARSSRYRTLAVGTHGMDSFQRLNLFPRSSVKLDGEPAVGALSAGNGSEAHQQICFSSRGEDLGAGVVGVNVGDGKGAKGTGSLSVHEPLRNDLAVAVRHLQGSQRF